MHRVLTLSSVTMLIQYILARHNSVKCEKEKKKKNNMDKVLILAKICYTALILTRVVL